jgi:hypothetical protein
MSDKEEQSAKLDLDYTPERAEELKENIEAVQKEIDEVWAEVEGQGGVKVRAAQARHLSLSIAAANVQMLTMMRSASTGSRIKAQAC